MILLKPLLCYFTVTISIKWTTCESWGWEGLKAEAEGDDRGRDG